MYKSLFGHAVEEQRISDWDCYCYGLFFSAKSINNNESQVLLVVIFILFDFKYKLSLFLFGYFKCIDFYRASHASEDNVLVFDANRDNLMVIDLQSSTAFHSFYPPNIYISINSSTYHKVSDLSQASHGGLGIAPKHSFHYFKLFILIAHLIKPQTISTGSYMHVLTNRDAS